MAYLDPSSSRAVMWKEILSGVIASKDTCVNDYRSVNEMNDIISQGDTDNFFLKIKGEQHRQISMKKKSLRTKIREYY